MRDKQFMYTSKKYVSLASNNEPLLVVGGDFGWLAAKRKPFLWFLHFAVARKGVKKKSSYLFQMHSLTLFLFHTLARYGEMQEPKKRLSFGGQPSQGTTTNDKVHSPPHS